MIGLGFVGFLVIGLGFVGFSSDRLGFCRVF